MRLGFLRFFLVVGMAFVAFSSEVLAQAKIVESDVDPAIFRIDENRFLGVKPDESLTFRDQDGRRFTFGEMTSQPLILVLSYYSCDGACSLVNNDLAEQLKEVKRLTAGRDFRILTVSFDTHDTAASLAAFRGKLDIPPQLAAAWRFSLPSEGDEVRRLAETVGFKYFWSPRDRIFLHPGVFVFFSPEGRVVRFLYSMNARPLDVELALIDAKADQVKPSEIVNFALSLCYSYNYMEGRYTVNIAFLVGFGSLVFGLGALFCSLLFYRRRVRQRGIIG
ncbi:protein SCO1 [Azospirillaceae bacterium]